MTKDVDVLDVLNKQVSNTPDPQNSRWLLLCNLDFGSIRRRFSTLHLGRRRRLKEYAHFTKYDPIYHEALVNDQVAEIDREIDAYLGGVLSMFNTVVERGEKVKTKKGLPLMVWQYNRSFYDKIMAERCKDVCQRLHIRSRVSSIA